MHSINTIAAVLFNLHLFLPSIFSLYWSQFWSKIIGDFLSLIFFYRTPPGNLDKQTTITVDDKTFTVHADDLVKICDLGRGAYGIVEKMRHIPSDTVMAVKVHKPYSSHSRQVAML